MFERSTAFSVVVFFVIAGHALFAEKQTLNESLVEPKTSGPEGDSHRSSYRKSDAIQKTARRIRVIFVTQTECERCEQELNRLRSPGGDFEKLQAIGWKIGDGPENHIQIVDRESIPELIELLKVREYPTVACIVDGEIVRSFKDGCTTPLDIWTFGWLLKGENERPKMAVTEAARVETTGNYRLRGNHWSVEGDPNPTKEAVVLHLRGANHANSVAQHGAIENWSLEELRSLHDDIHEREGGPVAYYGRPQQQAANRSLEAFSGSRKVMGR